MPLRQQISGQLFDSVHETVTKWLKGTLQGEYAVLASDGWKDESRDLVNSVSLSVRGKVRFLVYSKCSKCLLTFCFIKTYLIDFILATSHKKDGKSMCNAFESTIDKAEDEYRVIVVAFCCDNDGGSQRGRKILVTRRPWLFGPPCHAHQVRHVSNLAHLESHSQLLVPTYSC
jgi:hypothetical protein